MMQSFSLGNAFEYLKAELSEQPYPLLFATVSGTHRILLAVERHSMSC